ncbi:endolytic transglycosylase MltG [Treponema pectinovorum]|uniref:endolytic transglycosylase MltG n=1 Tax=Treponema pectinovorum TaxID=164 RepID=UPI0011C9D0CB|nr:endolytic transglycosylase MltG [Treponema pectinovorum]
MKKKSFTSKIFLILPIFVIFFLLGFSFVNLYVPLSLKKTEEKIRVEIPAGTSAKKIAHILKQKNLIRSEKFFYLSSRFPFVFAHSNPYSLKSGVYKISSDMSVKQILALLESGQREYIKTVFPEGLTTSKIAEILQEKGVCSKDDFILASKNESLLKKYSIPAKNFEGFLFPDTYFFTPNMDATKVLDMMVNNFFSKVNTIPQFKDKNVSEYYKTVILASIVEREYRLEEEAPLIASVFTNRLQKNIGLYSCATIEYVITEIMGKPHPDVIKYEDLKIDSPYNTYKWAGLTPTPISNPGMVALEAAANPPKTDYYFFTLADERRGNHIFTKNFTSHIQAGSNFKTKKVASF